MSNQLDHMELELMRRQGRNDEIEQARKDGRLARLLGVPEADIDLLERARGNGRLSTDDLQRLLKLKEYDVITRANAEDRIDTNNEGA